MKLQETIESSAKLNEQYSNQISLGDVKAVAMANLQTDFSASLQKQLDGISQLSQAMRSTIEKQKDDLVSQKIDFITSNVKDLLNGYNTTQTIAHKDMQLQMEKFHSTFVNQQRSFEYVRHRESSNRKRHRDSESSSEGSVNQELCQPPWSDHGSQRRAPAERALADWQSWTPACIRDWMESVGCPLFASVLFPSVGSGKISPVGIASGKMLLHLHDYVDQIVIEESAVGTALNISIQRKHLKSELAELVKKTIK